MYSPNKVSFSTSKSSYVGIRLFIVFHLRQIRCDIYTVADRHRNCYSMSTMHHFIDIVMKINFFSSLQSNLLESYTIVFSCLIL